MKQFYGSIALLLSIFVVSCESQREGEFLQLKGSYMGQTPPGKTAEVFASGVISIDAWELEGIFAPGMREFYFVTKGEGFNFPTDHEKYDQPTIFGFRFENNHWRKFTEFPRTGEPFIATDDQTMYLAKGYRERSATGWSEVKSLGPLLDRDDWGIMRLTASTNATYVFDDYKSKVMRVSKEIDGKRQAPVELPEHINSGDWTAHPFIAPNESYLIWDSEREDGFGDSDLYISFRQADGSWGAAINMGANVNSDKDDFYGSVTPDGNFLMFNRTISESDGDANVDIYWVDAQIIEELRPKP